MNDSKRSRFATRGAAAVLTLGAGLGMGLGVGLGQAHAAPEVDAVVASTCTYPQVVAALQAEDPVVASEIQASPLATGYLQRLVAGSPDERRNLIAQFQSVPATGQYLSLVSRVVGSCSAY